MLVGMDESTAQLTPTGSPLEWHRLLKGVAVQHSAGFFPFVKPFGHGITVTINGGPTITSNDKESGTGQANQVSTPRPAVVYNVAGGYIS